MLEKRVLRAEKIRRVRNGGMAPRAGTNVHCVKLQTFFAVDDIDRTVFGLIVNSSHITSENAKQ